MPRWVAPLALIGLAVVLRVFGDPEQLGADALAIVQIVSAVGAVLSVQIAYQEVRS